MIGVPLFHPPASCFILRALRGSPRPAPAAGDLVQRIQRLRARSDRRRLEVPQDEAALARRLGARAARLVEDALALLWGSGCRYGCPACVGPVLASDEARGHSPRAAAMRVLELVGDVP